LKKQQRYTYFGSVINTSDLGCLQLEWWNNKSLYTSLLPHHQLWIHILWSNFLLKSTGLSCKEVSLQRFLRGFRKSR